MKPTLHITSGDTAGDLLEASGIDGDVFVWHDVLYDGPRISGWPTSETLETRAHFLSEFSDGGLRRPAFSAPWSGNTRNWRARAS